MDKDGFLDIGSKSWAPDTADGSAAKLFAGKNKPSLSRTMIGRLHKELGNLLSSGARKAARPPQHPHGESAFRFLLANELKRSERSGRSFHVLLTYFAEADGGPTPIDGLATNTLVPILSGVLRETDYIGWYRDSHVLGGVLTALQDHSADEVASRIEQRFWWKLGRDFPASDFARLRVRFFHAQEFGRLESAKSLFAGLF